MPQTEGKEGQQQQNKDNNNNRNDNDNDTDWDNNTGNPEHSVQCQVLVHRHDQNTWLHAVP